ncbi:hypothetical protein JOC45_000245 [Gordonia hydrophobica]|nr:hypothetical protein [Gordonia hydrophobica]
MSLDTTDSRESGDADIGPDPSAPPSDDSVRGAETPPPASNDASQNDADPDGASVVAVVEEKVRNYALLRRVLLLMWAVSIAVYFWFAGIAADRTSLIFFLAFGMAAATVGRRRVITIFIDWLPFVLILMLYDWTRNIAVWLDMPTHWHLAADVDHHLFGVNPTVWLQSHLKESSPPWWEVIVSVVYMSYFIVPYATAAALWVRDRAVCAGSRPASSR